MNGTLRFAVVFALVNNILITVLLLFNFNEIAQGQSVNIILAIGQIVTGFASAAVLGGLTKQGEL